MDWHTWPDKMVSYGKVKHKVWKAFAQNGFYATSGLDNHGHFELAKNAMKVCEDYEKELRKRQT